MQQSCFQLVQLSTSQLLCIKCLVVHYILVYRSLRYLVVAINEGLNLC